MPKAGIWVRVDRHNLVPIKGLPAVRDFLLITGKCASSCWALIFRRAVKSSNSSERLRRDGRHGRSGFCRLVTTRRRVPRHDRRHRKVMRSVGRTANPSRLTDPSHDVAFSSEWITMADLKGKLTPAEFLAALKGRKPPAKHIAPPATESIEQLDLSHLPAGPAVLEAESQESTQSDDVRERRSGRRDTVRATAPTSATTSNAIRGSPSCSIASITFSVELPPAARRAKPFRPKAPETLEETGLTFEEIERLILKFLLAKGSSDADEQSPTRCGSPSRSSTRS